MTCTKTKRLGHKFLGYPPSYFFRFCLSPSERDTSAGVNLQARLLGLAQSLLNQVCGQLGRQNWRGRMRPTITVLLVTLFFSASAQAQTPAQNSRAPEKTNQAAAVTASGAPQPDSSTDSPQDLLPVGLQHRQGTLDSPQAKSDDQRTACPGGNGKACASLGGRVYFSDTLALSRHSESWADAARSPGMLLSFGLLTASTIADLETAQSCIHAHSCREGDPLLGQSRYQAYPVAMSFNVFAFWATAEQKRHGHGAAPFFILWCATAGHAALAAHNASLTK